MNIDDPVGVYLNEVGRVAPLSHEEEIECIEHVRRSDRMSESAATRLAEAHLGLVVSIAEEIAR
jgi:RNA polymerase primary sigma factor